MSEQLKQFLTKWLAWAEAGATTSEFHRKYGLCLNLYQFAQDMFPEDSDACDVAIGNLTDEFHELLRTTTGDTEYPFDGRSVYDDYENGSMHKNPARLAWVREQLEKSE